MEKFFLVLFAYLLGSVLFGELITKLKGIDIRRVGSGNVGATNVSRALGKKYGILVFFLDMLKGFLPTALTVSFYGVESKAVMFVGIASVLGHMFSIFAHFRGGKGVATAFGVVLALSVKLAILLILVWGGVLLWKRYVSLASITASLLSPVVFAVAGYPLHIVLMSLIVALLILVKHKPNIERLMRGEERKV